MRFNPKARLDRGRVKDTGQGRGNSGMGGAGMRLPIPGGVGTGGIGGVILVVLIYVLVQCMGGGDGLSNYSTSRLSDNTDGTSRYDNCKTGEDANNSADCARVAVENSLTDYWGDELGSDFQPENQLITFTDSVDTGCGGATSDVGPFYCPVDATIYLDTDFFDEVLEQQLGGPDGGFVEYYVLAHEYGHHIQNLRGTMSQVKTQQGPQSDAVRLELQADCFAGMWAKAATSTEDAQGEVLISELTKEDIQLAIEAAEAVGDDRIQQKTQGQVTEESWTHGSAAMREQWFLTGFEQGSLDACDTFAAKRL
jgi:predicted metalloprotease